jgi:VWFA-related protein
MKKLIVLVVLVSLSLGSSQLLVAQTRPRRVDPTTVARQPQQPPTIEQSTQQSPEPPQSQQSTPRRPPVLQGDVSGGRQTTTQESPNDPDGPIDVGEGDVVRVDTALVTIPVSVMDRSGRYIPNLTKQDFHIFEDGVEHDVAYFASVEKPFTVALVIDTSGSTQYRLDEIQDAAISFVDQLRPEDRVMVVSFSEDVHVLSEPTSDRRLLRNAIRRTTTGGGTSLYEAVDFVINRRFNNIEGRKAIVLFTDGVDTTSKRASYQSNIADAEELDALIYPVQYDTYQDMTGSGQTQTRQRSGDPLTDILIDIFGGSIGGGGRRGGGGGRGGRPRSSGGGGGRAGSSRNDYEMADRYLGDLADRTGARRYRADNTRNLSQTFGLVAEELRRQYSIGYYPHKVATAGQRRQIKVRVNQPDLVVRARDSYTSTSVATNSTQTRQPFSRP